MTDHLTENARLRAALEFYANPDAWNQPPVRTLEGLFTVEYENEASKMQRDRGKIARAALATPAPDAQSGVYWCGACRNTNAIHCAHPDECGNMRRITRDEIAAQADSWKSWLDDLPLPEFQPAIDDLQDYLTIVVNALFTLNIEDDQPKHPAPDLMNPTVVHANMLRGTIAKPTVAQIIHLYGSAVFLEHLYKRGLCKPTVSPAPDAVQEAARVLLDDEGRALPRLVEIAEAQWDAGSSMSRCIGAALRAIAESEASHE